MVEGKKLTGGAAVACWCYWNAEYQRGHITKLEYLKRTGSSDADQQAFLEGMAKGA